MAECTMFKSGKDLGEETQVDDDDTVICVACRAVESDESAFQNGWQLVPPVCPNCLRWALVEDAECCFGRPS